MRIDGSVALVTGANRGLGRGSPGNWSAGVRPGSTGRRVIRGGHRAWRVPGGP